jgi:hypothetical protein
MWRGGTAGARGAGVLELPSSAIGAGFLCERGKRIVRVVAMLVDAARHMP